MTVPLETWSHLLARLKMLSNILLVADSLLEAVNAHLSFLGSGLEMSNSIMLQAQHIKPVDSLTLVDVRLASSIPARHLDP